MRFWNGILSSNILQSPFFLWKTYFPFQVVRYSFGKNGTNEILASCMGGILVGAIGM